MKQIFLLLNLISILTSFDAFSFNKITSEQAYDKAQILRGQADSLIENNSNHESLKKAEGILVDALNFVRQENIKAMYSTNKYLAARQWDILRDLIKVNSLQKDEVDAVKYLADLSFANRLYWVAEDEAVTSLLGENILFKNVVSKEKAWARVQSTKSFESTYNENISDEEKIAGLSLLWSEVRQGFVFFDQVPDLNWDEKFKEYIPRVLNTDSTQQYYKELIHMVAQLNDAHTNVYYPSNLYKQAYSRPPFRTALIEGRVIVTEIFSESLRIKGVSVGDEILKIDDREVHEYVRTEVMPFQSSSTPQDLNVRAYKYALLSGDSEQPVTLKLKDRDGHHTEMSVSRSEYGDERYPSINSFKIIEGKFGYFKTNSFSSRETVEFFKSIIHKLNHLDSLIIDIRNNGGGSSNVGFEILSYLTKKTLVGSTSFARKNLSVERAWGNNSTLWKNLGSSTFSSNDKHTFQKPVIVLAGAETFSAAEDFLVAFKQSDRGLIIGETTGGSSGQPLVFSLPGGGTARVCVKRDKYQSGEDWVGVGISPDIIVKPTVVNIQNKEDVVLNAALLRLTKN